MGAVLLQALAESGGSPAAQGNVSFPEQQADVDRDAVRRWYN
ncbi:MAG: hypothetical protein WAV45_17050 [Propionibacteriaceae bacterium]